MCHEARLAQLVERKALNLVVVGSSPTVGVSFINVLKKLLLIKLFKFYEYYWNAVQMVYLKQINLSINIGYYNVYFQRILKLRRINFYFSFVES